MLAITTILVLIPRKMSLLAPHVVVESLLHGFPPLSNVSTVQNIQSSLPPIENEFAFNSPLTTNGVATATVISSVLNVK